MEEKKDSNRESECLQKSDLLGIVNRIAQRLLPANLSNLRDSLYESMQMLAKEIGIKRIVLFQNKEIEGSLCFCPAAVWPIQEKYDDIYRYADYPFLEKAMLTKKTIHRLVSLLPEKERTQCFMQEIGIVLCIPLYVGTIGFWGCISFGRVAGKGKFAEEEISALYSASILLASAIQRNISEMKLIDANKELQKTKELLQAVNEVAQLIITNVTYSTEEVLRRCLQRIGESVHAKGAALWEVKRGKDGAVYGMRMSVWNFRKMSETDMTCAQQNISASIPQWSSAASIEDLNLSYEQMDAHMRAFVSCEEESQLELIPLFIQDVFKAFVAIGYHNRGYRFNREEKDIIRSGGLMMLEAVAKHKMTDDLHRVRTLAATDALTGLLNRTGFAVRAETIMKRAATTHTAISVLYLDIDFFKQINDSFGHAFGDMALVRFSEALKRSLRPTDLCARFGGDEFVVLLSRVERAKVLQVAERIRRMAGEIRFREHPEFAFTVCIGIKSCIPDESTNLATVIHAADTALYRAKNKGRNRIVCCEMPAP